MQLKIFKNQFIRTLATKIAANRSVYLGGDFQWTIAAENSENYFLLEAPWCDEDALLAINGISNGQKDEVADPRDAKALYGALNGMPAYLARDSRIWTTLTHTHCLEYVRNRNWKFLNSAKDEEALNSIKSRFFIDNTRSYERTNAIARLWWFGYIGETTGLPFDSTVDILLDYTDFRAATVERPEVFAHKEIRAAVVDLAIKKKFAGDDFSRDRIRYRQLFKDVTERATRVFFPTMEHSALVQSLDTILLPKQTPAEAPSTSKKKLVV